MTPSTFDYDALHQKFFGPTLAQRFRRWASTPFARIDVTPKLVALVAVASVAAGFVRAALGW